MSLHYPIQQEFTVFGSKSTALALTGATLTGAYADNRKIIAGVGGMSKLDLRYSYTTGASETNNTLTIVVEQSADGTNWFGIMNESVSGGTSTITQRTFSDADNTGGGTTYASSIGLDIFYKHIRVSAKENNVAANYGTIYMEGTILGE